MPRARSAIVLVLGALCLGLPATALAQDRAERPEPKDQIVLSGDVFVRRGQEVGEVVVLHGSVTVALGTPIRALGSYAPWLAIWLSVLALGFLLLWLGPRSADATVRAALGSPWPSAGWGVIAFVALPLAGLIALLTLVLLPLGIGVLLALFLLTSVGLAWSAFALGRLLWREPRGRVLALLFGWAILAAAAAIPFVGGALWLLGSAFGLGACTIAIWRGRAGVRVRATGGRHRAGVKMPSYASADPEPMVIEREMGEEGAG